MFEIDLAPKWDPEGVSGGTKPSEVLGDTGTCWEALGEPRGSLSIVEQGGDGETARHVHGDLHDRRVRFARKVEAHEEHYWCLLTVTPYLGKKSQKWRDYRQRDPN